jgi:DNA repair exonuclease SbcCD nuclease subunit
MPRRSPSRRELMRWSASALLAANLWPGKLFAADKSAGDFDFFIINDLHVIDDADGPWLEKIIASMKSQKAKPEFCIIAGDLVDDGTPAQYALVGAAFKSLGLPIYTLPGNHDYDKKQSRAAYEEACPKSLNYTFEHKGWQFVNLDSTDGTKAKCAILTPTFDYVDQALPKLDKSRPTLLITHFPQGPKVTNRSTNADDLLDRFKPINLSGVFGGHYHAYTATTLRDIPIKTNRCCSFKRANHDGSKQKGYFLCSTKDGKVTPTFVEVPQG